MSEGRRFIWRPKDDYTDELNEIETLFHNVVETWYDNVGNGCQVYDFSNGKPDSMDRLLNALKEVIDAKIEFDKDTDPANPANNRKRTWDEIMKKMESEMEYIDED